MKYSHKSFSVLVGGTDGYRDNWEQTFRGGHGAAGDLPTPKEATSSFTPPVGHETPSPDCLIFRCRGCGTQSTLLFDEQIVCRKCSATFCLDDCVTPWSNK